MFGVDVSTYSGVVKQLDGRIFIGLNAERPESNESSLIHELCHNHLENGGYPCVRYDSYLVSDEVRSVANSILPKLAGYLCSVITHPSVYRMMDEKYKVDMSEYFDLTIIQKKLRLEKSTHDIFSIQQDVIDAYEYYYYTKKEKDEILDILKEKSTDAYYSISSFMEKVSKKYNAYNSVESRIIGNMLLDKVKSIGIAKKLGKLNEVWNGLVIE